MTVGVVVPLLESVGLDAGRPQLAAKALAAGSAPVRSALEVVIRCGPRTIADAVVLAQATGCAVDALANPSLCNAQRVQAMSVVDGAICMGDAWMTQLLDEPVSLLALVAWRIERAPGWQIGPYCEAANPTHSVLQFAVSRRIVQRRMVAIVSEDAELASALMNQLQDAGCSVWLNAAPQDIPAGMVALILDGVDLSDKPPNLITIALHEPPASDFMRLHFSTHRNAAAVQELLQSLLPI